MTNANLKVGVVGAGFIGPAHIEALRRLDIQVLALCKTGQEPARQKAAELGVERAYGDFDLMLADADLDVIHITSPNFLHAAQAKAALQAGKHVVCEKPLAMNPSESSELARLAKASGKVAAVNFNLRFYPLSLQARAMLRNQEIGRVNIVQGSYLQDWLLLPSDWNWRLEPELGGELRAVADIGSHWLDLTTFITGLEIEAVLADFATFLPVRQKPLRPLETFSGKLETPAEFIEQPIHTEDYAAVLLRFKGGARGMFSVSQVSAGRKNRLTYEINGAQSSLAWNSEHPNELWIGHRQRPNELMIKDPALLAAEVRPFVSYPGGHNEGFPDTFKQLYQAVYTDIRAGGPSQNPLYATFDDGHRELVWSEAILRSARQGHWVTIVA